MNRSFYDVERALIRGPTPTEDCNDGFFDTQTHPNAVLRKRMNYEPPGDAKSVPGRSVMLTDRLGRRTTNYQARVKAAGLTVVTHDQPASVIALLHANLVINQPSPVPRRCGSN